MGSLFSLILLLFLSLSSPPLKIQAQGIKSAPLLDLVIRDYTFKSYNKNFRTGSVHSVHFPANLSGIGVEAARFRCGSLRRYGAEINEFHLGKGVIIHPCIERVMLVRQNLGQNWSSIYYENYELSGYQLISPVLGLLAYNAGDKQNSGDPFEINIISGKDPIRIDFGNVSSHANNPTGLIPLCASFGSDGKVKMANLVEPNVCAAAGQGHFGLVIESPMLPERKRASRWKVAIGSSIGAALGAFLLSLLLIALLVKVKKKARMEEMERRAYEEEALQVTMVGHVRAPTATVTRTVPAIEHGYRPTPS